MTCESLIQRFKKVLLLNARAHTDAWRIHFRHLSCNETHQVAFEPFIDFLKDEGRVMWDKCGIIVWEERISVEFSDFRRPHLSRRKATTIFDWTTGQILLVSVTYKAPLNRLLKM